MTQIGFKGAIITRRNPPYSYHIAQAYDKAINNLLTSSISVVNTNPKSWYQPAKQQKVLSLWGKDNELFNKFLNKHTRKIPVKPEDMGLMPDMTLSRVDKNQIKASKLAQAITQEIKISKALTSKKVSEFIKDSSNLKKNVLSSNILKNALKRILNPASE